MSHPSKEKVRKWLADEVKRHRPPPDPRQVRRELGWDLLAAERNQKRRML
ncbi:MAG TPA: hypothetical protein VJ654_14115 [Noviherbaspirillum sp.]|nr:hypothetical protein [Noviherbaspirillum sp.]